LTKIGEMMMCANRNSVVCPSSVSRSLLLAALVAGSWSASAQGVCDELQSQVLLVVANGYVGRVGDVAGGIQLTRQSGGRVTFQTTGQWSGEAASVVQGECLNRHLRLKRTGPGNLMQVFDGWVFEQKTSPGLVRVQDAEAKISNEPYREMAGVFSHQNNASYGWHARLLPASAHALQPGDSPRCSISGRLLQGDEMLNQSSVHVRSKSDPGLHLAVD
jgi:hypothetical protein